MSLPLVIYHAHCTDGFGAALAAWKKFGDQAEYVAAQHGSDLEQTVVELAGSRTVYVLDFSFSRATMNALIKRGKVIWLDHHKTSFETVDAPWYAEAVHTKKLPHGGLMVLDNTKSGAMLAWLHFVEPSLHNKLNELPLMIQHIDDHDRWQHKIENTRNYMAMLNSLPKDFVRWNDNLEAQAANPSQYFAFILKGTTILETERDMLARSLMYTMRWVAIPFPGSPSGLAKGLSANLPVVFASVGGHELSTHSKTFGLVWIVDKDLQVRCSLRSTGDYDVSAIAKFHGGGGHRNAAGFQTTLEKMQEWLT